MMKAGWQMMNLLTALHKRLRKNDFVHSVSILVSGTALSQAVIVALTPLLTRLYTPEDFGVLSVYSSLMLTVAVITSLHYETAIPLPKKEKDAINLLALALFILLLNVMFATMVLALFKVPLMTLFNTEGLHKMIGFLPLSILGFGLFQVYQLWYLRDENYPQITKGKVRMNVSQVFSQTGLGLMASTSFGLIVGEVMGRLVGGGGMALASWKEVKKKKSFLSLKRMWELAVRYRRFPLVSSWSSLLSGLTSHLPMLFIAYALGVKAAGWYLLASRILALPDALLGYSVKQVYMAKSARMIHADFLEFSLLFWRMVKQMSVLSVSIYLPMTLLAPFVFPFVFGENWGDAGMFVQCMSILFLCQFVAGPVSATFILLEEQYIQVMCEGIRLVLLLLGMLVSNQFLQTPWQVVLCLSVAGMMGFLVIGFFSWVVLARRQRKIQLSGRTHYG